MFFNRKNPENQKEKTRICCPIFPPRSTTTTTEKKTRWKIENERKKNTNYPLFEVWTNLCETWEKKKNKNHCDLFAQLKKKILRRSKVWGMVGPGTGFCWLPRPRPSPNLAGHTHLHCLTSLSVSSCRQGQKWKQSKTKHKQTWIRGCPLARALVQSKKST